MICRHKISKSKQEKSNTNAYLPLSSADEHIHCIHLMHFKLRLLMVLSAETKGHNHSRVETLIRPVMSHTC